MKLTGFSRLISSVAVTLMLVSVVCVISAGFLEGARPDTIQSAAEELDERSELDEIDKADAIVGRETLPVPNDALVEEFRVDHDAPQLTHMWRWRSRGPPAA